MESVEKPSERWRSSPDERCLPHGAQTGEYLDAEGLNPLIT
jgi:hypothetical protein